MKTFYKVLTRIGERRSTIFYAGTVEANTKPQNTFTEFLTEDVYEDYFDTESEALAFVAEQRRCL